MTREVCYLARKEKIEKDRKDRKRRPGLLVQVCHLQGFFFVCVVFVFFSF